MSSKIINVPMNENIINAVCGHISGRQSAGADFGKTAVISGGKRPFLFIKKELALRSGKTFYSPHFFSNDDFIERIMFENSDFSKISDLEAAYILFETVESEAPVLLKNSKTFESFLQWAYEILFFIEQTDFEKVTEDKLNNLSANAQIGYDVPDNINELLKNIFKIRKKFHETLESSLQTTKGYSFLKCSEMPADILCGQFDEIVLTAPFYLHKTELEIYKKIFDGGKLTVFAQGDPLRFETLKKIYDYFNYPLPETKDPENKFTLNVYSAYDDQSQAVLLKNLIKAVPEKEYDKTAVIVPKPEMIQSVVAEISAITGNYNVSAGYPASKTAVFSLVKSVMRAQLSRKGKSYYAKDVVSVLTNPLVKNMRFFADASVSRIIAHKIEKALDLSSKGSLSGKLFIDFEDILNHGELLKDAGGAVAGAWKHLPAGKLKGVLEDIFKTLFVDWEKPDTLNALSETVTGFLEKVSAMSVIQSYPLDREALEILISAARDLKCGKVANARFGFEEMLNIFEDVLKNKKIALPGSPLKGLQILGILESRNLSFDNVYIVAMNDSSFPAVTKEFPLVPKDIMFSLGIEMAKKEFEIQSYHFQRLIACSKNLSLIYSDNEKDERSRFAEDLIWQKQFLSKDINCAEAKKFVLSKPPAGGMKKNAYEKTGAVKAFLKNMTYSHTKIDAYLRCRLGFYFRYVLGLDENIEVGKEVSQSDMGTFIHKFLSGVFRENTAPEEIRTEKFKKYYLEKLLGDFDNSPDMKSREDAFLIKKVLEYRMERLLAYEKTRDYGIIFKCEEKYVSEIEAGSGKYKIECFIDRIDKSRGSYGIYDYKTGNAGDSIVSAKFDELISAGSRKNIKKAVKSLQLPLYKYIFENSGAFNVSQIALYDVKRAKIVEFPPDGKIYSGCIDAVKEILEEINSGESFEFDENDKENCLNCKYFYICR